MKIYISVDMEWIPWIVDWDEVDRTKTENWFDYEYFTTILTNQVKAACEGALKAWATEIYVKDAHRSWRNINFSDLPKQVKIIRGWSWHPFSMMQEIDQSFDAAILIGYHSAWSTNGNPLSHTMTDEVVNHIKINWKLASEFWINSMIASYCKVPVVFISWDKSICQEAKLYDPTIQTVQVLEGVGDSSISLHPQLADELVKEWVEKALRNTKTNNFKALPESFEVEIEYVNHADAYKFWFYPWAKQISSTKISFSTKDYFEVLRFLNFVL